MTRSRSPVPRLSLALLVSCGPAVAAALAARAADLPRVALLVTERNGPETGLVFARPGEPLPAPVARLRHRPDAAVRGTLLPGTDEVAAVADTAPGRDRSWGSTLFLLAPGRQAVPLCDRVAYAARPLVTPEGTIVVSRGVPGEERNDEYRVDRTSVDEVDPRTGGVRTLFAAEGYAAFPAALHGGEVVLYVVGPNGARIVAADRSRGPGSRAPRVVVASLPPFARDFSATPDGRLVFACREEGPSGLSTVESVSLESGERKRLHVSASGALAPFAWGDGAVTWNGETGGLAGTRGPLAAPGGGGLLEVGAAAPDGTLAAAYRVLPGAPVEVVLVDGRGVLGPGFAAPPFTRLEIAGVLP